MELERLNTEAKSVRDLLIECNQRLVHSLATKHLQPGQTLGVQPRRPNQSFGNITWVDPAGFSSAHK